MNSTEKLKRLASLSNTGWTDEDRKKVERKYKDSMISGQADMETWFENWCLAYCSEAFDREVLYDGNIMYKLTDGCIFDRNHKDASVIIRTDGKICYHCFHDSCSNNHWSEFREYFDPAYKRHNTAWQ